MSVIIKRVWNQNKLVNIESLHGMTFQAEDGGHIFQISGVDDTGAAVELSGTVAGVFRRPDNADIALTGAASNGVVSIALSDACYAVPGRFGLTVFVTSGGNKTAVYAAIGTVASTTGGAVAGSTPQDVVDLINSINTAVNSIPADYTDLLAAIAPDYSDQSVYAADSYRWHDGLLYKNPNPITTAESWTAAHWKLVNIGDEIKTLKNIFGVTTGNLLPDYNAYGWTSASSVVVDRSGCELIVNGTKQNDGVVVVTDLFTLAAGSYSFGVADSLQNSGVMLQLVDDQSEVVVQTNAQVVFSVESSKSVRMRVRLSGSTTYNNVIIKPMLFSGSMPGTYIPQLSAMDYELRANFETIVLSECFRENVLVLTSAYLSEKGYSSVLDLPYNRCYAIPGNSGISGLPGKIQNSPCTLLVFHPVSESNKQYTVYVAVAKNGLYISLKYVAETSLAWKKCVEYDDLDSKCFLGNSFDPTSASSIVLLGDSVVQGAGSSDFSPTGESIQTSVYPTQRNVGVKAWGSKFVSLMANAYGATCVNNGVAQMNIEDVYNNVNVLVPSGVTDAVIMCGLNDRYRSKSTIQSEMSSLLQAVLTKGVRPYVFSVIDFNGATYDTSPEIIQQAIKAACNANNVPFFDLTTLWSSCLIKLALEKSAVFDDTLHPNDRGHELILSIVRECLEI